MKKTLLLFIPVFVLLLANCTKKDDPDPTNNNNNNNNTTTSPYYFKFTLDGKSYNINATNPQYMVFDDALGGYQTKSSFANANDPSVGLRISWDDNAVNESEILALKGKTLPFNYDGLAVSLSFMPSLSEDTWFSVDTFANTSSYNVKITNITFLKDDVSNASNFKTYVITGTCTALMEQGTKQAVLSGGEFNMIVAKKQK